MKRYLGTVMNAYCAIVYPIFLIGPIVFAVFILSLKINFVTVVIAIFLCCGTVINFINALKFNVFLQLYSFGKFTEKEIHIRTGILYKYEISYQKCKSIGIGRYTHRIGNSQYGPKYTYIFFSYEPFHETYRTRINQWKPTKTRIKVGFDRKLYAYLLTVLPERQAVSLRRDYEKYMVK